MIVTEIIIREMQRQLKDALSDAQRNRELSYRALERIDHFEARLDAVAADIRAIRSDVASIDIKLSVLPQIEASLRAIKDCG